MNPQQYSQSKLTFWFSLAVAALLLSLLLIFIIKCKKADIPILKVLIFLIANELFFIAFQLMGVIDQKDMVICKISMIGRLIFIIAANFWIVFITRLVYIQANAPGKYFHLIKFIFKNLVYAYIPSIVLSTFLLILMFLGQSESEAQCWKTIQNTQLLDYIVYCTAFVLPNLVTSLILVFYLFKLKRLRSKKWSIFLVYPITAIGFSLYYMYVKIYEFYLGRSNFDLLNLFLLIEPLAYGIYFIIIYLKLRRNNKVAISSEITIKGSDGDVSFIDDESGSI